MDAHRGGMTFVFTDIEGSTQFVRDMVSSYGLALRIHRRILQTAIEGHGGKQMGSEGDGLFFCFAEPVPAVNAAIAVQQKVEHYEWPEELRLRVRIGIHHGPVRVSGGEYVGLTVHDVARICAAAHGGQILCSATVVQALRGSAVADGLRDLGAYALHGSEPRTLFQVTAAGLEDDFPPPRGAVRDGGAQVTIWRRQGGHRPVPAPAELPVELLDESARVEIRPASEPTPGAFRLVVTRDGVVEEEYDGLTIGGVADAATVVNAHSLLIRIAERPSSGAGVNGSPTP